MARHRRVCKAVQLEKKLRDLLAENERLKRQVGDKSADSGTTSDNYPRPKRPKSDGKVAIYAIVHKPTLQTVYVGKTTNLERRFQQHVMYTSQCRLIRDAFLKEGKASFEIRALMYCSEADADKNESMMITKMNTLHPNGLNLRCGTMAGAEEADNVLTTGNLCTDLVPFEDVSDECEATARAWANLTEMLTDVGGEDVDDVCKKWLKQVHPDVSNATFSATEVAAIVNNIREVAGKSAE